MNDYMIEMTIRRGDEQPWHFRMSLDMPSSVVPSHVSRSYFEHVFSDLARVAMDKLYEDKLPQPLSDMKEGK